MHSPHRPSRRDWLAALAAGSTLGILLLGVGARAGMRMIALRSGQQPAFTIEGSIAVSLMGAATGALIAIIFMGVRVALPTHRWIRGTIFWAICAALVLRGLHPVSLLNARIFLPLFLAHGILLHVSWCRYYLPRHVRQLSLRV